MPQSNQIYSPRGIRFIKADKSKGTRSSGALKMRRLMFAAHSRQVDNGLWEGINPNEVEEPALYFVDKCVHCISTIPELPTDPDNPDDVVTEGVPDHLYDAVRYEVATELKQGGYVKVVGL